MRKDDTQALSRSKEARPFSVFLKQNRTLCHHFAFYQPVGNPRGSILRGSLRGTYPQNLSTQMETHVSSDQLTLVICRILEDYGAELYSDYNEPL